MHAPPFLVLLLVMQCLSHRDRGSTYLRRGAFSGDIDLFEDMRSCMLWANFDDDGYGFMCVFARRTTMFFFLLPSIVPTSVVSSALFLFFPLR